MDITTGEIRGLRRGAAEAGDEAMMALCDRALEGDADAIAECAEALGHVTAQEECAHRETTRERVAYHSGLPFAFHSSEDFAAASHDCERETCAACGSVRYTMDNAGESIRTMWAAA